jgi:hypothetical protein
MADYSQANFADMGVAHQAFQDAVERCGQIQTEVDGCKADLATAYTGGAANALQTKMTDWQNDFTLVKGALARMTLELSDSKVDYQKQEDVNAEIAAAIASTLNG